MATHYEILGVDPRASAEEIRKAYLRRARALHPDRNYGRPPDEARAVEQAMQQVNVAWNVLSDPPKKLAYDNRLSPRGQAQGVRDNPRKRAEPGRETRPTRPGEPQLRRSTDGRALDVGAEPAPSVWASIPVLAAVGLLLGVLIIVAFADREPSDGRPVIEGPTSELSVGDCFVLVGATPRPRSCSSGAADGQIVEVGPDPGNCPTGSFSIKDPDSDLFLCWARMIPGSTITTP